MSCRCIDFVPSDIMVGTSTFTEPAVVCSMASHIFYPAQTMIARCQNPKATLEYASCLGILKNYSSDFDIWLSLPVLDRIHKWCCWKKNT